MGRPPNTVSCLLVVASSIGAAWASLWLQWYFPQEDDIGFIFPVAFILVGAMLGVGIAAGRSKLTQIALIAASLLLLPSAVIWFVLTIFGPILVLIWLPGIGAFFAARAVGRRSGGAWCTPVAFSLLPWVLALSLFAIPPLSHYKWCWPWLGFRSELVDFERRAVQAGSELGFPRDQGLTREQRERLAQTVPVVLTLQYPFIGKTVRARIDKLDHTVMLAWGPKEFGPLNVRWMHILYASD